MIESSLIAAGLWNASAMNQIIEFVEPQDFQDQQLKKIYECILEMYKDNKPVEFVSLSKYLVDKNIFSMVKDKYVNLSRSQSIFNLNYYIQEIKRESRKRQAIQEAWKLKEKLTKAVDVIDSIAEFNNNIENITSERRDFVSVSQMELEKLLGGEQGLQTGFVELDMLTNGLHKSELIIIAGRTSTGKTTLCLNILKKIAKDGKRVLLYSLEMSPKSIIHKLLSSEAGIDSRKFRNNSLTEQEFDQTKKASENIKKLDIIINDNEMTNVNQIVSSAKMYHTSNKLDCIFVDYLQLIKGNNQIKRYEQIGEITRALKSLAKNLEIPVVAMAQLSRAVETRVHERPRLSDLRESGDIEQDADVVMLIWNNPEKPTTVKTIIVAKARNDAVGEVELSWNPAYNRFGNYYSVEF